MFLDFKLNFQEHFENMLNKVNKTTGLLRKIRKLIMAILSVIKRIMCLFNKKQKAFCIMQSQPLQELYVEHLKRNFLKSQDWRYRKLCCFYKIVKDQSPKYLFNIIRLLNRSYPKRTQIIFLISKLKTASSKILSFRQPSLNGINWTLKFKMLLALIFSKRIF